MKCFKNINSVALSVLLILILFSTEQIFADQDVTHLSFKQEVCEESCPITYKEVCKLSKNKFKLYNNEYLKGSKCYWVKITIQNVRNVDANWFLHFNNTISNVKLFQFNNDSIVDESVAGVLVPEKDRTIGGFIKDKLPFILKNNCKTVLYLRINNPLMDRYKLNCVSIISKRGYEDLTIRIDLLVGILIGAILIIGLLNFILFVFRRKMVSLYYSIYLFLVGVFFLFRYQFTEFLWLSDSPRADLWLMNLVILAQLTLLWLIYQIIKDTKVLKYKKYLNGYCYISIFIVVLGLVIESYSFYYSLILDNIFTLTNTLYVFICFVLLFKKANITIRLILIGSTIMIIGGLISLFSYYYETSILNSVYYQIGVFIEIIFFTIAINYTYNKETLEKIRIELENSKLELENYKSEVRNRELSRKVERTNRVLTAKSVELMQKENLINETIKLIEAGKTKRHKKSIIQNVINNLNIGNSNNWDEFETYFNNTHPEFYLNLNRKFPNLTSNDRKLIAFIKLNFSTKEISLITGKQTNSIDVSRSRLRKKMGVASGENLNAIIASIKS